MKMPEIEPTAAKRPVWNAGKNCRGETRSEAEAIWEIGF